MAPGSEPIILERNYLQQELYDYIKSDSLIFELLQEGVFDGLWYWDLVNPENEWMNHRFWELFGYEPESMKHLVSEWHDIIFPEDLEIAKNNLSMHLKNPSYPYDQVVRYKHKTGSTVWVRCRGFAIHDENGTPVRMLGAHTDVTELMENQQQLLKERQERSELEENAIRYKNLLSEKIFELEQIKITLNKELLHDTYGFYSIDKFYLIQVNKLKTAIRVNIPINVIKIVFNNGREQKDNYKSMYYNVLGVINSSLNSVVVDGDSVKYDDITFLTICYGYTSKETDAMVNAINKKLVEYPFGLKSLKFEVVGYNFKPKPDSSISDILKSIT